MSNSIPEDWSIAPIGDICNIAIGGTPSRSIPDYWDSTRTVGSPWVSIRDLNKPWIYETSEWITDAGIKNSNVKLVRKGTVIMSFKLSVGRVAFAGRDLYTNEAIAAFLPKRNNVYSDQFLYQGLQHWNLLENIDQAVKGVTLNKEKINQIDTVLPPLPEQQKIAAILSSVDNVIEKTRAQIDKLKDLKTGMMQELLTKGIGHTEFKDSPVGRIPKSWEITNLGSIVIPKGLQTGPFGSQLHAHEYVERGVPVVMPKDMKMNRIDPTSIAYIPEARAEQLDKHRVREGDLLFARRGDIGRFALVESKNEGWVCGTGCLKARLSPRINPIFISSYLTLTPVIEWLNLNAVGQTMLNLNTAILADLPIILPPDDEQEIIGDAISALDNRISSCHRKLVSLTRVKSALMQDLLTGKVRVNVSEREYAVA